MLQGVIENIIAHSTATGDVALKLTNNVDTGKNTCDKAKIQLNGQDEIFTTFW